MALRGDSANRLPTPAAHAFQFEPTEPAGPASQRTTRSEERRDRKHKKQETVLKPSPIPLVGTCGFEPQTSCLSSRRSKPTELCSLHEKSLTHPVLHCRRESRRRVLRCKNNPFPANGQIFALRFQRIPQPFARRAVAAISDTAHYTDPYFCAILRASVVRRADFFYLCTCLGLRARSGHI